MCRSINPVDVLFHSTSADSAPIPLDPSVRVVAVPARALAVHEFTGSWGYDGFVTKRDVLLSALRADGLTPNGDAWEYYRYNPPFTLPFLRRNEVAIPVDLPATASE